MKKSKNILSCILFSFACLLISFQLSAQNKKADSLLNLIKTDQEDTNKVTHLYKLCREYSNIGEDYKGLPYGKQALILAQNLNFKKGIAQSYNNIGVIYFDYGNYPEALKNYFAALKAHEETKNKQGIATSYNNIGNVYKEQRDFSEALKNHFIALKIYKEIDDKKGIAMSYNNIGNIYHGQKNYNESLKMHFAALKLLEESKNKIGIAASHNNIGTAYSDMGNYPEAFKNFFISLKIKEEIKNKNGMISSYINLGELYIKQNNIKEARNYFNKGLKLGIEIGSKDGIRDCYEDLALVDSTAGDYKAAFTHNKLFIIYRDSLNNEESKKKSLQAGLQYEFDKKEIAAKAEQDKTDAINAEEKRKQQIVIYTIAIVLIIVILFSVFLYSRFRIIRNQRNLIEAQKQSAYKKNEEISEQKEQIESNLIYTKKLQDALKHDLNYYMQLALRKQMNPHFIFNSLNSIQSFILQNDKLSANLYLSKFSDLMRRVLENSENKFITIKEELDTLELYIQLEQKRFEEKFDFELKVCKDLDCSYFLIPPLILQPYVENAIWHGLLHKTEKGILKLEINKTDDKIIFSITDNGIGREEAAKRKSVKYISHESLGTKITAKRLELINSLNMTDFLIEFKDLKDENGKSTGTTVNVTIPIKNIFVVNTNSDKV